MRLNVLDLYSGLHGWAEPFIERGHRVVTADIGPDFGCTVTGDFLDPVVRETIAMYGPFDLILASPPCETFSMGGHGSGFDCFSVCCCGGALKRMPGEKWGCDSCDDPKEVKGAIRCYPPKNERGATALALLEATVSFCEEQDAPFLIENPRGLMRKMDCVQHLQRRTVTYCQYGQTNMKPTDLFGPGPAGWVPRPMCKNGAPCHEAAPRRSRTGTQGIKGYALRSKIPYELALEVCIAAERARRSYRPTQLDYDICDQTGWDTNEVWGKPA